MAKREDKQAGQRAREMVGLIWGLVGILGTVAGLATFLLLDIPELLQERRSSTIEPAAEDEVLVIVTSFGGDETLDTDNRIYRALEERAESNALEGVRIERLAGETPILPEEANAIGERYDATLVIWGSADRLGIEPRYQIVRNQTLIHRQARLGVTTADAPTFSVYVVEGVPAEFEYLMLSSLGQIAYFSGDYAQAQALFSEALALPLDAGRAGQLDLATVYFFRGYATERLGDSTAAHSDYDHAIELNPSLSAAYYNRGLLSFHAGDYDTALADYDAALVISPTNSRYLNNRGLLHYFAGRMEQALADYDAALAADPDYALAYNNRGYLYYEEGDLDQALTDTSKAIELDPDLADAYDSRGAVYHALGDDARARTDYDEALALDPSLTMTYYNRARALEALGEADAALADYQHFLELYGRDDATAADAQDRIAALESSAP
jgi:Tfp pilus assembly protein PilF